MKKRRKLKELSVVAARLLTKNMQRITLQGTDLGSFPENAEGAYIKLIFPTAEPDKPVMRTYTVAKHRSGLNEIDVDFMLHAHAHGDDADSGVAAQWSMFAKIGDKLSIGGPGPATFINTEASWYLLAADMTALPALTANLALLPKDAKGYVVVEILSEEDKQDLPVPPNMQVSWVINPHAGSDESPLFDAISELNWLENQVSVWAACEFKTMKKIRQYLRADKAVDKQNVYISSYWKQGLNEEQHKVVKKSDAA